MATATKTPTIKRATPTPTTRMTTTRLITMSINTMAIILSKVPMATMMSRKLTASNYCNDDCLTITVATITQMPATHINRMEAIMRAATINKVDIIKMNTMISNTMTRALQLVNTQLNHVAVETQKKSQRLSAISP